MRIGANARGFSFRVTSGSLGNMARSSGYLFSLMAALLAGGCAKHVGPAQSPTQVAREKGTAKAPAKILSLKVSYVLDEKGNYVRTMDQRYQVLTLQGVEGWSSTGSYFTPWYMTRPTVDATVTSEDGKVIRLDPKTIAESPAYPEAPDMYSDAKVLRAPLPSVAVGSTITEHIVEQSHTPFFVGGRSHALTFQLGVPVDAVELTVDAPASLDLKYEIRDAKVTVKDERPAGRRHLTFSGGPYDALKPLEANAPSDVAEWPYVIFSTTTTWNELAKEYHKRVTEKLRSTPSGVDLSRVVDPSASKEAKVNRLLMYIHDHVRYVGMEFGESSIIPAQPGDTLKRGYGDCKDQSVLLVKLLSEVGVEARVALLRAGRGEDVRPTLPAMNVFNHAIVYVPGDKPFWADPTSSYARAGDIPSSDQGRLALIVDTATDALTAIPVNDAKQNLYQEEREVFFPIVGSSRVVESSTGTGVIEQGLRRAFSGSDDSLRKSLKKYIDDMYTAKDLGDLTVSNPTDIEKPFAVKLEAKSAADGTASLLEASIVLELKPLFSWIPSEAFEDEPRKLDFIVPDRHMTQVTYRIHIPDEFVVKKLGTPHVVDLGPVTFAQKLEAMADNTVKSVASVTVATERWSPAELEKFRKGYKKLGSQNRVVVELEHLGQRYIDGHRVLEGLNVFRAAQDKNPKSGVHAMRLALNLVDLGFGNAARGLADKAVALEPESAAIARGLAAIYMRDEFGRAFHKGFDRDKAAKAYERASSLDDDDTYSQVYAALLYEYDPSGERYLDQKALEKAVKIYDAIEPEKLTTYDNGAFANNVLYALLWSNRMSELKERISRVPAPKTPPILATVTATLTRDPNAGIAELERLGLRGEPRSDALSGAADILVQMRRYPEAAQLVAAAASGSSKSVEYEGRARYLEKVKVTDLERLPENSPAAVVQKFVLLGLSDQPGMQDQARKLVAKDGQFKESNANATLKVLGGVNSKREVRTAVIADIMRAVMQSEAQGEDATGFRIKVRTDMPGMEVRRFEAYVVKQRDGYRVRTFQDGLDEVGQQALAFIRGNRQKAAETWLKWAADGDGTTTNDDPLNSAPWLRLWKNGTGNATLAAAALCGKTCGSEATSLLETARAKATLGELEVIEHALLFNYWNNGDYRKMLEAAERVVASHPTNSKARRWQRSALFGLKDYAAAKAQAEKELERAKDTELEDIYGELSDADSERGKVKEARKTLAKLIELGRAGAQSYGNCAWYDVVLGKVDQKTLEYASHAVQMTNFEAPNLLHTLATVYAEMGKSEEAKQTLDKLLALRENGIPADIDWYVIGRIAENYAINSAAREAYERVKMPEHLGPTSTYPITQRRLKQLK